MPKQKQKEEANVKFSDEEMKEISDVQQQYQQVQMSFGQIMIQRTMIDKQFEEMDEAEAELNVQLQNIQEKERNLATTLNEKYGPGSLDPQTGVFSPASSKE
jgi:DNA repair exonuclease SbcCD ATPase subunit